MKAIIKKIALLANAVPRLRHNYSMAVKGPHMMNRTRQQLFGRFS